MHQLRILQLEFRKEAAIEFARMKAAEDQQHKNFMKDYGYLAVRSVFLLHGGALVSLIAFMGSIADGSVGGAAFQPADFMLGFSAFVAGLFFVMLTMIFAYLNYQVFSSTVADPGALANAIIELKGMWPHVSASETEKNIMNTYNAAWGTGIVSMICFLVGCGLTMAAFSK